ncbi:hypothetical protein BGZ65_002520 [Modicella reniformis]|uniref:Uncharacterized protein n=1 Tax=Modicella reniformis TaxID=1440133 RepID=A0A9P6ILC0_9FUNG|nr:hypothetical protein BGZ65_002520 [Modicella reniformis]
MTRTKGVAAVYDAFIVQHEGKHEYKTFCDIAESKTQQEASNFFIHVMNMALNSDIDKEREAGREMQEFWQKKHLGPSGRCSPALSSGSENEYGDAKGDNAVQDERGAGEVVQDSNENEKGADNGEDGQQDEENEAEASEGDENEDLIPAAKCSPFPDLVAQLYKLYGHNPPKIEHPVTPFPSTTIEELYAHASSILTSWGNCTKVERKDCLVALSGVVNTIDMANRKHYSTFDKIREGCIIPEFMKVTTRQEAVIGILKNQLGIGKRQSLSRLRRYCSRRSDDLEEQLEKGTWPEEQEEALSEEMTIMNIMMILCKEIEATGSISKISEVEDVVLWRDIARVLFSDDIVIRIGELGSQSTREDRSRVETIFGGAESRVRSRRIDLFFQRDLPGFDKPVELFTWEAKSLRTSQDQLYIQRKKNIRLNACLANKTATIAGFPTSGRKFPHPAPIVLDIEGRRGIPYVVHKIEPGVFAAGLVMPSQAMICLPYSADDIEVFLDEGHLSSLLNLKTHNLHFLQQVKKGAVTFKNNEALARMLGQKMGESETCVINTPTKKLKRRPPQEHLAQPEQQEQQKEQQLQQTQKRRTQQEEHGYRRDTKATKRQ